MEIKRTIVLLFFCDKNYCFFCLNFDLKMFLHFKFFKINQNSQNVPFFLPKTFRILKYLFSLFFILALKKLPNTSPCQTTHTWRGKSACLVYSSHTCRSASDICSSHNMKLFAIDDDFDLMLIVYFTTKQFRDDRGEFWIKIYDYDECVALISDDGNFKLSIESFENDARKHFFCEF